MSNFLYCDECSYRKLGVDQRFYVSLENNAYCHICDKLCRAGQIVYKKVDPTISQEKNPLEGYMEIPIDNIKIGTKIKYITADKTIYTKAFLQRIEKGYIVVTDGKSSWTVQKDSMKIFVKIEILKSEEQIKQLEAKIQSLTLEKENLVQSKKSEENSVKTLENKRKFITELNSEVPQEVLDIVDDFGFFDMISLFRSVFKFDTDIKNLDSFVNSLSVHIGKSTQVSYVSHTVKITTTEKTRVATLYLCYEIHLGTVYELMKQYFKTNIVTVFPIDGENPVTVTQIK
jgi:hypothetical protein